MGRITVLPAALASQIAAGEVVERPASALKELVENALDAGATRCDVEIDGGGVTRLCVRDDGVGMSPEDAVLCMERHATSKLSRFEDLTQLASYGFRGEALPSIASVSRCVIETRRREHAAGTRVSVEGGGPPQLSEVGMAAGTRVSVSDLFYNVPARRKFLRSSGTEAGHITEVLDHAALAAPQVTFTLQRDGRKAREWLRVADRASRVAMLFEGEELAHCQGERGPLRLEAFLGRPEHARIGTQSLKLFCNSRPVRDRALLNTLSQAYGSVLERGRYPRGVVYVELPAELVDINVHPQKSEVRFADSRAVTDAVYEIVSRQLASAFSMPISRHRWSRPPSASLMPPSASLPPPSGAPTSSAPPSSPVSASVPSLPAASRLPASSEDDAAEANLVPASDPPWPSGTFYTERAEQAAQAEQDAETAAGSSPRASDSGEALAVAARQGSSAPPSSGGGFDSAGSAGGESRWPKPREKQQSFLRIHETSLRAPGLAAASESAASELVAADLAAADLAASGPVAPGAVEAGAGQSLRSPHSDAEVSWGKLRFIAQVRATYLLCEGDDGLYVLDQHAAAERVNFHRLKLEYEQRSVASQALLFPVALAVTAAQCEVIAEHEPDIQRLGFDVRIHGEQQVSIHRVPRLLQRDSTERLFRDLVSELSRAGRGYSAAVDAALSTMACHGSVRAGDTLEAEQAKALLKALDDVDFAGLCPHGRPVVTFTSWSELERKVGRR